MPRIPESELGHLKQDIALERLVGAAGIALKKHGQDLIGLCPFHDDHNPSLVITPSKNLWHCLGCGAGGSVIDWVMKLEGVSFRHAVELLQANHQPLVAKEKAVKQSTVRKLAVPFTRTDDDQQLLNQVIDYYHETLKQNPEALAYLKQRGLDNTDLIDRFKLGVANRTLGYRLPAKNRKAGSEIRGRLTKLGLYRDSGHEHFNGCVVIPVLDEHGNVAEVYGRRLTDKVPPGTPRHLYLPGPHQGVFNLDAVKTNKEIILCESLIDALTFWSAGYRNVTASYGVEGFTNEHLAAFKQHEIERVLIAYDRDEAGNTAAGKLAKQLNKEGIDCYRILFPKGMDANDYALNVQPATKSLGLVIRKAEWLGKGRAKPITTSVGSNPGPATTLLKEELTSLVADLDDTAPLPATPMPESSNTEIEAQVKDHDIVINRGDRRYRIRGLNKNTSVDQLKVNLLVSKDETLHVDTFDLYAARPRAAFIKQAAIELGINEDIIKKDLGQILLKLESLQETNLKKTLESKPKHPVLSEADETQALDLLKDPKLLDRILADFTACGVVGEETNKLIGYLAAVSRKLDDPLAILIQSTSAAGKTALMDAVLDMMPEEEKVQYSAMTGQSLFYLGESDLKHKILAIAEEAGAHQAAYALKLLQSEGQLTIASTGKDPDTGKHLTHEYTVEGPVMIFSTTTAIDIDEELLNRCLVLTVDESREQTRAIHQLQREKRTLEGLNRRQHKQQLLTIHRNAQRLLKPLAVVNPYAEHLTFLDDRTRMRRDHEKYLTLIDVIALLHQHQRPIKHDREGSPYIEITLDDIAVANKLAHEVLGRSLDELPPQTRKLLLLIETLVTEQTAILKMDRVDYRFSRKAVRQYTGWSDTQVRVHLDRMVDLEYLLVHKGGRGNRFVYELLYDGQGQDGNAFMMGLIDIDELRQAMTTTPSSRGEAGEFAGSSRPQNGPNAGGSRSHKTKAKTLNNKAHPALDDDAAENTVLRNKKSAASYRNDTSTLVAKG